MSCTENDSGPFVVFFLPAVVGCLTILLARRWANSQVSGVSTTAVSRRRKIIKDPLIKRPLPPVACKMMPTTAKKSPAVGKKVTLNATAAATSVRSGTFPTNEDDIAVNGKKCGRSARPSHTAAVNGTAAEPKTGDGTVLPKHIPFPQIPQDGELLFEVMTFTFTSVAAGLQFLNLYRTVWWLPHSHTNQTMNFYLIDPHVVAFILTILARRLLLSASTALLQYLLAPKMWAYAVSAARMFILGVVLGALVWCTYFIVLKYPLVKIFYLCYPVVVYFVLFGLESGPFLQINNDNQPLHSCMNSPDAVREEIDTLRKDFNLRVKKILFNSVVGAYYSSFIPCSFAQPYLYYDVYAATHQLALVWGGLCTRYASQLLNSQYCDVLHRSALHLGAWQEDKKLTQIEAMAWSEDRLWARGSRVAHAASVYVSLTPATAATPGFAAHTRFYAVFRNPSMLLCLFLSLQLSLILLQLCLLFSSSHWHNFFSLSVLLFTNYYTLFKLVRDYIVAWKVYKAEYLIQEKTALPAT